MQSLARENSRLAFHEVSQMHALLLAAVFPEAIVDAEKAGSSVLPLENDYCTGEGLTAMWQHLLERLALAPLALQLLHALLGGARGVLLLGSRRCPFLGLGLRPQLLLA